jgi:hypothetical protein
MSLISQFDQQCKVFITYTNLLRPSRPFSHSIIYEHSSLTMFSPTAKEVHRSLVLCVSALPIVYLNGRNDICLYVVWFHNLVALHILPRNLCKQSNRHCWNPPIEFIFCQEICVNSSTNGHRWSLVNWTLIQGYIFTDSTEKIVSTIHQIQMKYGKLNTNTGTHLYWFCREICVNSPTDTTEVWQNEHQYRETSNWIYREICVWNSPSDTAEVG